MADDQAPETNLSDHLHLLAADADDVAAMLTRAHEEGGDIHPEALGKSARLATSLREVIHALREHDPLPGREPLAMKAGDVWAMLSRRHAERDDGTIS